MNVYFDSSSLAKRYIDENGSAEVDSILQENIAISSEYHSCAGNLIRFESTCSRRVYYLC